jgi:hypothetical protein
MEFGASPFPETRRTMIERGRLFETPCFRWLEARQTLVAEYSARVASAPLLPGDASVFFS